MEDLDERLILTEIKISCWKDQLKQAVSQLQFTNTLHEIQTIFLSKTMLITFKIILHFIFYTFIGVQRKLPDTSTGKHHPIESRPEKSSL